MTTFARNPLPSGHERGAALVVGLLLLTVITLLAIAGMNSASVELMMAGNVQYQQRAFQASEVGIETVLANGTFLPGAADVIQSEVAVPGTSNVDKHSTTLASDLGGEAQPAIWGNSTDSFSTYHFTITSLGESGRKARTTHLQGVALIAPFDDTKGGSGPIDPGS